MITYMQFTRGNADACVDFIEKWVTESKMAVYFPAFEISDIAKIKVVSKKGGFATVNEWDYLVIDNEKNFRIYSPYEFERLEALMK